MKIAIPKERKNEEYRVALTPEAVKQLVEQGHQVMIEQDAGVGAGYADQDYRFAGASILPNAAALYASAKLIVKVKEPQPQEYAYLRADHMLFCYLHLAAEPELTEALMKSGTTAIAFETVTSETGGLPLLAPMSQVAGRLAIQAGARFLEREFGGAGVLLCPIGAVNAGTVIVIGAGHVGLNAVAYAAGIGAEVIVLDRSQSALDRVTAIYGGRVQTRIASAQALESLLPRADLVVGAVLVPGASAPKVLRREHLQNIRDQRVLVDVAIDQGGCFETSRPTTHDDPVYIEEGVIHYCVTNMPGVVPRTSTKALSLEILPYTTLIAEHGIDKACEIMPGLANGINVRDGKIVLKALMESIQA